MSAEFGGAWSDMFGSVLVQHDGKLLVTVGGIGDFTLVRYMN